MSEKSLDETSDRLEKGGTAAESVSSTLLDDTSDVAYTKLPAGDAASGGKSGDPYLDILNQNPLRFSGQHPTIEEPYDPLKVSEPVDDNTVLKLDSDDPLRDDPLRGSELIDDDPVRRVRLDDPLRGSELIDDDPVRRVRLDDPFGAAEPVDYLRPRSKRDISDLLGSVNVDLSGLDFDQRVAKLKAMGYTADRDKEPYYPMSDGERRDMDKMNAMDDLMAQGKDYNSAYYATYGGYPPRDGTPSTPMDDINARDDAKVRVAKRMGLSDAAAHAAAGVPYHRIETGPLLE